MPTNRVRTSRLSRGGNAGMTVEQYEAVSMTAFFRGKNGADVAAEVFNGDRAVAKRFYAANRAAIEARVPPGSRSELWWFAMAPEPCGAAEETLRLYQLGVLAADELAACRERLREWHNIDV